ncbi:MAG: sigma 54-interacting transcriptional regulator [Firmicutes bacterium]|nr:sigma 54-interacting transcriptional regulator [Bacillota bacterium]
MKLDFRKKDFYDRGGLLDQILDTTFDRAMIVDKECRVIYFSQNSQKMSGKTSDEVIGKRIDELLPNTGFKKVLQTGESDEGIMTLMDGSMGIASHIPVFDHNELLGAIGIVYFNNIANLKKVLAQMPQSENQVYEDVYHSISKKFGTYTFDDYIGESQMVKDLIEKTKNAALSKHPVLLIGETGTGKEILANAIHNFNSNTFTNEFVKLNCSAIPGELLESELFGHEKGAFTGANAKKLGKFELANNGSILLDEIGDMNDKMQTKLLRVLEEKEFERVGGNRLIATNARIIASTNVDLRKLSHEKKFRMDLYYRLNILEIRVPSLREHITDIPLLVNHLIKKNKLNIQLTESAIDQMMRYAWPGNVRELRNVINRFGVLHQGATITGEMINDVLMESPQQEVTVSQMAQSTTSMTLEEAERKLILQTLSSCNGNKSQAAAKLAISRSTLNRKIAEYELNT